MKAIGADKRLLFRARAHLKMPEMTFTCGTATTKYECYNWKSVRAKERASTVLLYTTKDECKNVQWTDVFLLQNAILLLLAFTYNCIA